MNKYIDAEKLIAELRRQKRELELSIQSQGDYGQSCHIVAYENILSLIISLQQEQPNNIIQWTGNNLKEVIDFTGKSPRFGEWFKSWEEYENYVHQHNDILKLFCEDGSHFEVPVGAWIVKTPDGYNVPSVARFIHAKQEQPKVDLEKLVNEEFASHSRTTEYGLEVTYNRAELYQFIKRMALVFNARKEE